MRLFHGKSKEDIMLRREESMRLRVVERMDYREIAAKLGISYGQACKDCQWVLDQKKKGLIERDEAIRHHHDLIYKAILDKYLPIAVADRTIDQESLAATGIVTKVLVDQAKLHGFTVPVKETPAAEVGKQIGIGIIETMARLAQKGKPLEAHVVEEAVIEQIEDKQKDEQRATEQDS